MIYFRLPFGKTVYTTDHSQENHVRFISFDGTKALDFPGKLLSVPEDQIKINPDLKPTSKEPDISKDYYIETISGVIDFLKEHQLKKMVISRKIRKDFTSIDLKQSFLNLCNTYPNAFCYVFLKEDQCWIGAFSEILGKFNKTTGEFSTMSLAGTLPIDDEWTEKEIVEQQTVTDYVSAILERYSKIIEISQTYDHISGNIKHLRTDFSAKIKEEDFENLITELHPTPAVCGIPKDVCRDAIQKSEKHSRSFYSGYSRIDLCEEIICFVNLRCAEIHAESAYIYAGGGITQLSNPENEWNETELKASAVLKNLVIS